jgi:hypothetical protein
MHRSNIVHIRTATYDRFWLPTLQNTTRFLVPILSTACLLGNIVECLRSELDPLRMRALELLTVKLPLKYVHTQPSSLVTLPLLCLLFPALSSPLLPPLYFLPRTSKCFHPTFLSLKSRLPQQRPQQVICWLHKDGRASVTL